MPTVTDKRDLRALLEPLMALRELHSMFHVSDIGAHECGGLRLALPRIEVRGADALHDPIKIALFGGLHGDEPAGILGAIAFLEALAAEPAKATGYVLYVYPLCNPSGYIASTRENFAGFDLNRQFWRGSQLPEVKALERELTLQRFDGIVALHSDDTAEGMYGYTHGRVLNEALLEPALKSAGLVLPRDPRPLIDGFEARDAKIHHCYGGVLAAPPDQHPKPFDLILETPSLAPIARQVEATVAALDTILEEYRQFIAYAANL